MQNSQHTQPACCPTLRLLPCRPKQGREVPATRLLEINSIHLDINSIHLTDFSVLRPTSNPAGHLALSTGEDDGGRGGGGALYPVPLLKQPQKTSGGAGTGEARPGGESMGAAAARPQSWPGPAGPGRRRVPSRTLSGGGASRVRGRAGPGREAADGTARGAARHVPPDRYPRYPCGFPSPALADCLPSPPRCPPAPHDSRDPFPPPVLPCPALPAGRAQRLSPRVGSGRGQAAVVAV